MKPGCSSRQHLSWNLWHSESDLSPVQSLVITVGRHYQVQRNDEHVTLISEHEVLTGDLTAKRRFKNILEEPRASDSCHVIQISGQVTRTDRYTSFLYTRRPPVPLHISTRTLVDWFELWLHLFAACDLVLLCRNLFCSRLILLSAA